MNKSRIQKLEKENSLLREHMRKAQNQFETKIAELSMIRDMGMVLRYVHDFRAACSYMFDVVINNTVAQNCSIMLFDREKEALFLAGASDPGGGNFIIDAQRIFSRENLLYRFKAGEGAAGKAFRDKRPVLIADTEGSPYFNAVPGSTMTIGSLLCVPLLVENESIGVINLSHPEANVFKPEDSHVFSILANFVAIAVNSITNYEKLKNSELTYKALSENLNDGIAIIQNGLHVYVNPKYQEMTGYGFEELRSIPLGRLLQHEDREDTLQPPLTEKGPVKQYETQLACHDGKKTYVGVNASHFSYHGKPALILAVRDLTEHKKLQHRLNQAQKMEAIGNLAGGVAHDLNNILSGIVGYPELLLLELPPDSPLRKPIETIHNSGVKAAAIVNDMLTLARRGVMVTKAVNLNDIISSYLKSPECAKLKAFHPHVRITAQLETNLLNVLGSTVHLHNTLMNLVSNAAEAVREGGKVVIVTKNALPGTPLKGAHDLKPEAHVMLQVIDDGVGMSQHDLLRIFEPFYTKKVMGRSGTGLGMSVVWGTVKDHNGSIDVESVEGAGTTCTIYFPATTKEQEISEKSLSLSTYTGNGERLLIVDDVDTQRDIATSMLRKLNYSVQAVASGEDALEFLKTNKADLIILDMIMEPGMDGYETYKRILEIRPQQKAIIASGFTETERVKEARKIGAGAYLRKPYTLEEIGRAVKAELAKSH